MRAAGEEAGDALGVLGHEIGEAEPGPDHRRIHALEIEHVVPAANKVRPNARVDADPLEGLPGVLHVDAVVAVPDANVPDRGRAHGLPVEPGEARGGIARIDLPVLFKDEPVVHRSINLVTIAARRTEEPGLEFVRADPLVLEERHVGAQQDEGRRLQRYRLRVVLANERAGSRLDTTRRERVIVDQDLGTRPLQVVVSVLEALGLVVVGRRHLRHDVVVPRRVQPRGVDRTAARLEHDRIGVVVLMRRVLHPVVMVEGGQFVPLGQLARHLDVRVRRLPRVVERLEVGPERLEVLQVARSAADAILVAGVAVR